MVRAVVSLKPWQSYKFLEMQGKRVQKCVESLDVLKVSNAKVKVPVVSATKWGISNRTPSGTREWEVFE